jgi:uncharacterized protein with HEPN domain
MLSERGRRKLVDIRYCIVLVQSWTAGMSLEDFKQDIKTFYAVTRALEIISEASRALDVETKARFPELPWSDIAGAGNVYRHNYEDVDETLIWRTTQTALPPLLAAVESELGAKP